MKLFSLVTVFTIIIILTLLHDMHAHPNLIGLFTIRGSDSFSTSFGQGFRIDNTVLIFENHGGDSAKSLLECFRCPVLQLNYPITSRICKIKLMPIDGPTE